TREQIYSADYPEVSENKVYLKPNGKSVLILGAFLDIFSALVIMVPLLLPVAIGYGINPVHLGIIFLANMQLGYLTPPVGINLFIASYRFDRSIEDIYRATIPMMLVLLVAVLIITYFPLLYY
ncbi:MAG TPA: TRAP transporter large permease subunit, partial [Chromatiales bacterium]|nr:TRAP transporter large permease subunit [Chromatiales bacterium]